MYGFRDDFPLLASGRGAETKTPLAVSKVEFNADDDDALMEQLVIDPLEIKVWKKRWLYSLKGEFIYEDVC